jgi:hypothetical protein
MKRAALAIAALVAMGGAPRAAEVPGPHMPCKALAKLKAGFDAKTHAVQLTSAQFHFVAGIYVGSPTTPEGLPPGDGALLVSHDGDKDGVIVWTRGLLACAPIPVSEPIIKLISSIKTGALNAAGDEM